MGLIVSHCIFHILLAYCSEFWALQYVSSPKAALIYNLAPLCTALLMFAIRGDRINRMQCAGIAIAFVGLLPLLTEYQGVEALVGGLGRVSLPEMALFISVFSSCYGWLLVKETTEQWSYHPLLINGVSMLLGGLGAGVGSLLFEFPLQFTCPRFAYIHPIEQNIIEAVGCSWGPPLLFGGYVLTIMLISNVIFYNAYIFLLRRYSLVLLSLCGSFAPLFTALFASLWRSEFVSPMFFYSFTIVLMGIMIFYKGEHFKAPRK